MISINDIRQLIYIHFVDIGRAPTIEKVSTKFNLSNEQTISFFKQLADDHIIVLEKDLQIRMALPFSNIPTRFKVLSGYGSWWANCAWDVFGIPAITGLDSQFTASCLDCGDSINVMIESGKVSGDNGIIHFEVPARSWWDDVIYT